MKLNKSTVVLVTGVQPDTLGSPCDRLKVC